MRLAVLADIHGNRLALECVLADMSARHVDSVVNLGDCVSGPLWPRETLDLLRQHHWPTVRGNHDRWVGEGSPGDLGASDRYAWEALDSEQRQWLRGCPPILRLPHNIVAMHACPDDDNAYLLEKQQGRHLVRAGPSQIRRRLGSIDAAIILTAHSHLAGVIALPDGPLIVNPGSVGCPAYDDDTTNPPHVSEAGSPAVRYAIVEVDASGVTVESLCLPYDHRAAAGRATENNRRDWAFALTTGFASPLNENFA